MTEFFKLSDLVENFENEPEQVYIEDNWIIVNVVYPYEIHFERCDTPAQILNWVRQLSQKRWVTAKILNDFTQLAFKRIGIELKVNV